MARTRKFSCDEADIQAPTNLKTPYRIGLLPTENQICYILIFYQDIIGEFNFILNGKNK